MSGCMWAALGFSGDCIQWNCCGISVCISCVEGCPWSWVCVVCVVSRLGGLWCAYIIRVVKVALRRSQVCVRFVNSIEMFTESLWFQGPVVKIRVIFLAVNDAHCEERETLLHFCARLGLKQVAQYLLEQPGKEDALLLPNRHGELPHSVAREKGFHDLAEMLSG